MAQRFLSNIKVNDAYTLPASDGTNGQAITTDGSGTLSFSDIAVDEAPAVGLTVKNVSGGALAIGTVVHPSPTASPPSGNVIEVIAADNSAASTMPAIGVLKAALADDAEGTAIALGRVSGLNTSSYTAGDSLYVNTSGGFTTTKPTGTALIQKIGIVVKSHASSGTIEVFGANRTNDVPNIAENYIWLGNSSGVATATEHLLNNVKDVTTSSPTDGQVLTWDNTNSYWKNADASSGGGGSETGTVTIEKDVFDGTHATDPTDGSNTTFGLTSAPAGKNNLQVYVDGVYQAKENFSLSGSTLTISPAPPSGVELEVIHIKAITGQISLDKFDGDNSTTAFSMSQSINSENNLQVYINGVYQSKDTYSTSGSTLTLTTAPATGAKIEVVHIKPVDVTSMTSDLFTGNGTKTAYDLTATPSAAGKTMVFIQGVYQEKSTYSLSSNTITFTTPPPDGYTIEVTTFGMLSVSGDFQWESAAKTSNFTAAANRGYFVDTSSSAITVTLPSSPSVGDTFRAIDIFESSDTYNITLGRNGNKINGLSADYSMSIAGRAVEFVYTGSSKGWYLASDTQSPAPVENIIEYIVVAGGGGGGPYLGGGGGAGGFRAGTFTPSSGTQYTVTVGAGGGGGGTGASPTAASKGGNSSISGTGLTTITSTGGGQGGHYSNIAGSAGGSGGGGGQRENGSSGPAGGAGNEGSYNPAEGFAGGTGAYRSSGQPYGPAGSGGGATEAGGPGNSNTTTVTAAQKGGDGKTNAITGSDVVYAGGGGGNNYSGTVEVPGGSGGGGNGAAGASTNGYSGTDGLGGGGGGAGGTNVVGGDGGDGVVILKIPTSLYTGTTTGSPTETTSGDYKILKFTSSGSYTH